MPRASGDFGLLEIEDLACRASLFVYRIALKS